MRRKSREIYPGQRGKEKRKLFERFKLRAIEEIYKKKFFALFEYRCFKCGIRERPNKEIGKPPILCIDHHIPMALGGHLVPGNLVSLCRRCNNKKLDLPPDEFYTAEELNKLEPILKQEAEIFSFDFDWDAWDNDRETYLISLGVEPGLVHELLFNPDHPDFVGLPTDKDRITISINIDI